MSKFRKWNSPAFNKGEVWLSSTGSRVYIIDVVRYPAATGEHSSDYEVTYYTDDTKSYTYSKDCWNFQVRYSHWADLSPHKQPYNRLLRLQG